MATRQVAIPINARNITFDTFEMVRGLRNVYDLPGQFVTPPGGGYHLTTPTAVGIGINNDDGDMVADLRNRFSYNDANAIPELFINIGNYQVEAHEFGYITIPTTVRDWFPSDLDVEAMGFISMSRSYDGSANEVLFSIEVLHHETGNVLVSETDISTGDDGYLNEDDINDAVGSVQNGMIVVSRLREQRTDQWIESVQEDGDKGTIGWVNGGAIGLFRSRTNGRLVLRGRWSATHIVPAWTTSLEATEMFYQLHGSFFTSGQGWSILTTFRNLGHLVAGGLGIGDHNVWPGLKYLDDNLYRMTNKFQQQSITVTDLDDEWACFFSGAFFQGDSIISSYRRIQGYSLERDYTVGTNSTLVANQGFGGIGIRNENIDFAEYVLFSFDTVASAGEAAASALRNNFAENSAFYLRGENRDY